MSLDVHPFATPSVIRQVRVLAHFVFSIVDPLQWFVRFDGAKRKVLTPEVSQPRWGLVRLLRFLAALTHPGPGGWLGYASWLWVWLWVSPLDLGVALGMRPGSEPGSGSPLLDLGVGLGMRPGSGPGSGSGPGLGPVLPLLAVVFCA